MNDKILVAAKDIEAAIGTYGLSDWKQIAVLDAVKFTILMTSWKKAEKLHEMGVKA